MISRKALWISLLLVAAAARAQGPVPLSLAVAKSKFLQLSGGTITGNLTVTGTCTGCSPGGTVTSVGNGTIGALFAASWATATTTPAFSLNLATQSANCILSGPTSGGAAVPTCRAMVAADLGSFAINASFNTVTTQPATDVISSTFRRNGAGQASNITEWQTEGNVLLAGVDKTGVGSFLALKATGTAGAGFFEALSQSSAPSAPSTGWREFADSTGRRAWIRASDGKIRTWDATLTADRVYTLPDASSSIPIISQTLTFTGPTAARTYTLPDSSSTILVSGGALGTPSSGVGTNLTGTAAGLTAGTVTTNANLTGPITSTGNATAIASQTGTGTKFVVDTNPALVGPTTDTLQTSGNIGVGAAPSATQGILALLTGNGAFLTKLQIVNTSGLDGAAPSIQFSGDASAQDFIVHRNSGNTGTALGTSNASIMDILSLSHPLVIRTVAAQSLRLGTGDIRALTISATTQAVSFKGTNTNDSATAGDVGELTSGTTAANTTSLSTGTTANVGAGSNITLTAGDWDCTGVVNFTFGATTSITNLAGGVSTTSATLPAQDSFFDYETSAIVPTGSAVATWVVPAVRVSVASSTNVFLVSQATFSVSTIKVGGTIRCRRMR